MGLFGYRNYKSSTVRTTSYNDKDTSPIMGLMGLVGLAFLVPLLVAIVISLWQSCPAIAIIMGVFLGCRLVGAKK